MRTKEDRIDAFLKRAREVMDNAMYIQEFTITIKGGVDEITTIEYDITEAVKDWGDKK